MPPTIRDIATQILDLHADYATSGTTAMVERQRLAADLSSELAPWAAAADDALGAPELDLRTKPGGRQSQVSPVPWVRVYAPQYSPRTTAGFYLVYLFAADGSCFYLSLNQGTSEWRSGKQRPINNRDELRARAGAARGALGDLESDLAADVLSELDLGLPVIPVGREAIQRYQNYELANVWGIRYDRTAIPDDTQLTDDLERLLPLLIDIYTNGTPPPTPPATPTGGPPPAPKGQGRVTDGPTRRAIEYRAMDLATLHYEGEEWDDVDDVSLSESYDLRCSRDGEEKRVVVKGTTGSLVEVNLTRNEVTNAQTFPDVALYIVTNIRVHHESGKPVATGGDEHVFDPWIIDADGRLTPTEYRYRLETES